MHSVRGSARLVMCRHNKPSTRFVRAREATPLPFREWAAWHLGVRLNKMACAPWDGGAPTKRALEEIRRHIYMMQGTRRGGSMQELGGADVLSLRPAQAGPNVACFGLKTRGKLWLSESKRCHPVTAVPSSSADGQCRQSHRRAIRDQTRLIQRTPDVVHDRNLRLKSRGSIQR